ncbi:MAG TPA: chorismate mutase [Acetobacteraceae bacterium]|nr:chorismate mutase [Acetobacteraceae bacterium]
MSDLSHTSPASDLARLRAEIDALDDALHDLLMQRSAIVSRLAASRAKGSTVPVRPGREASILRRLLARHAGPLPKAALVRLWREVLAASTALQGPFSVAVHVAAPGTALARLAREHFGGATPIRNHPTAARALAAVTGGEASVAVLPMPEDGEAPDHAWWTNLEVPRLQVVARLPFFGPVTPAALVVAPIAPDPSGEDRSLLRIEGSADLARPRIAAALEAAGLPARSLLLRRSGAGFMALAEVEGFLAAGDPRLVQPGLGRVLSLGAYAAPISGD